jgi:hypothetical protein
VPESSKAPETTSARSRKGDTTWQVGDRKLSKNVRRNNSAKRNSKRNWPGAYSVNTMLCTG